MVRKLALGGLAALLLAWSGCVQNRNLQGIEKLEVATASEPEHKDMSYISDKIPASWKIDLSDFTHEEYTAGLSKERLGAILKVTRFENEEGAIKYLESLTQKKYEKDSLKTKGYGDHLEITRSVGEHFISNDLLAGPATFYTLATRKGKTIIEVEHEKYKKDGRITNREKQELRELLYSLVK